MVEIECPNCGARYQVPEEALGPKGRDVTCSSCGNVWHATAVRDGPIEATAIGVQTQPPRRSAQMSEIRQMLDQVQRNEQRRPASRDEDDDPAHSTGRWADQGRMIEPPKPRTDVREAVFGHARDEGADEDEATESFLRDRAGLAGQSGRIRSTGRDGAAGDGETRRQKLMSTHRRRHRKFEEMRRRGTGSGLTGFMFVVVVLGFFTGIYTLKDELAARWPVAEPPLANYVVAVDGMRTQLQAGMGELRQMIGQRIDEASSDEEG